MVVGSRSRSRLGPGTTLWRQGTCCVADAKHCCGCAADQTVLNSVFFVLLRLLHPHLVAAGQGQGGLATFPIGRLFVEVPAPPRLQPLSDTSKWCEGLTALIQGRGLLNP